MNAEQIAAEVMRLEAYERELRERQREALTLPKVKSLIAERRRLANDGRWNDVAEVGKQIDALIESVNASFITERALVLAQLKAISRVSAPTGRSVAAIEADMVKLHAERDCMTARLRVLESERNVSILAAEIEKMHPARREAMKQLFLQGVPSAEKVNAPGARK